MRIQIDFDQKMFDSLMTIFGKMKDIKIVEKQIIEPPLKPHGELIKKKVLIICFKNRDILDRFEIDTYKIIVDLCKEFMIKKFSKCFIDLHNVESTKEFKESLALISERAKPIYIRKNEKYWWIGVENMPSKEFQIEPTLKEIYRVGLGMGLVPNDFINEDDFGED